MYPLSLVDCEEKDASSRVLRGNFDKASAHPAYDDRVVEEQRARIVRADTQGLNAGLRVDHHLRFDGDVERFEKRGQIAVGVVELQIDFAFANVAIQFGDRVLRVATP
jgi:hypothetical protein